MVTMRNKTIAIILLGASQLLFAQKNKEILRQIDSISQKKWDNVAIDLDSLDNPVFEKIDKKLNDTVYIKEKVVQVRSLEEQVPITPYNFLQDKESLRRWFFFGQNSLVFNQASFSNWNAGGNNNIGVLGKVNYNLTYKNNKHYLENIVQLGYGFVAQEGQSTRKTEDVINLSLNYGYELERNLYLSTGVQFISQFSLGYNYSATPDPTAINRISKFMAPGYLNLGLGFSYNPKENLQIIFRPINGQFTFVTDPLLQKAGKFGLTKDGQSVRSELGARLNILHRLKIMKDMNYTSQLNFFTNYLSHMERVDIMYSGALNMKFNKYITANVSIDLIYDHDQIQKLQRKQTLGIGLIYNMGLEANKSSNSKILKPFVK